MIHHPFSHIYGEYIDTIRQGNGIIITRFNYDKEMQYDVSPRISRSASSSAPSSTSLRPGLKSFEGKIDFTTVKNGIKILFKDVVLYDVDTTTPKNELLGTGALTFTIPAKLNLDFKNYKTKNLRFFFEPKLVADFTLHTSKGMNPDPKDTTTINGTPIKDTLWPRDIFTRLPKAKKIPVGSTGLIIQPWFISKITPSFKGTIHLPIQLGVKAPLGFEIAHDDTPINSNIPQSKVSRFLNFVNKHVNPVGIILNQLNLRTINLSQIPIFEIKVDGKNVKHLQLEYIISFLDIQGTLEVVFPGLEVDIFFAGLIGPTISVEPFIKIVGDLDKNPMVRLSAGSKANIKANMTGWLAGLFTTNATAADFLEKWFGSINLKVHNDEVTIFSLYQLHLELLFPGIICSVDHTPSQSQATLKWKEYMKAKGVEIYHNDMRTVHNESYTNLTYLHDIKLGEINKYTVYILDNTYKNYWGWEAGKYVHLPTVYIYGNYSPIFTKLEHPKKNWLTSAQPDITIKNSKTLLINVEATDSDDDLITFDINKHESYSYPSGMIFDAEGYKEGYGKSQGRLRWNPRSDGNGLYAITLTAKDQRKNDTREFVDVTTGKKRKYKEGIEGSVSKEIIIEVIDNQKPVIDNIEPTFKGLPRIHKQYTWEVFGSDPDDDRLTYHLKSSPDKMTIETRTVIDEATGEEVDRGYITWTPLSGTSDSLITIEVFAKDNDQYDKKKSDPYMYQIQVAKNQAPKITGITKISPNDPMTYVNVAGMWKINATDDGPLDKLSYSFYAGNNSPKMSIDGDIIKWTPSVGKSGTVEKFTLQASDGEKASKPFPAQIKVDNRPPEFKGEFSASTIAYRDFHFKVNVIDPDGDIVILSMPYIDIQKLADVGLKFQAEKQTISGVPQKVGDISVTVTATEKKTGIQAIKSYTITVNPNHIPTIHMMNADTIFNFRKDNITIPVGDLYTQEIFVDDLNKEDNVTLKFRGTTPEKFSLEVDSNNPKRYILSCTPQAVGKYEIILIADDGFTGMREVPLRINVVPKYYHTRFMPYVSVDYNGKDEIEVYKNDILQVYPSKPLKNNITLMELPAPTWWNKLKVPNSGMEEWLITNRQWQNHQQFKIAGQFDDKIRVKVTNAFGYYHGHGQTSVVNLSWLLIEVRDGVRLNNNFPWNNHYYTYRTEDYTYKKYQKEGLRSIPIKKNDIILIKTIGREDEYKWWH